MPVTDFLERNVKLYGDETALVELNPELKETRRITWKEYDLIQPTTDEPYRRRLPGTCSTKRPTALPTCFSPEA